MRNRVCGHRERGEAERVLAVQCPVTRINKDSKITLDISLHLCYSSIQNIERECIYENQG